MKTVLAVSRIWKNPLEELRPGMVIEYRLGGIGIATNYDEVWRGRVTYTNPVARLICIELLGGGYEGLKECVWWEQVISVDRKATGRFL